MIKQGKESQFCNHQYPGWLNLEESGERYCEEHAKTAAKQYEKYGRDPATRRRYGRAWKRIRGSYAAAHPLCEECLKRGVYTKMEEVHHIKPLAEGGIHARENLMPLCSSCYSRIYAERGDR